MGIERKTRVEPGISGKVTIIDGTTLLVLTFKEEELDLWRKKPGDNGDDDDNVGGDNDNDDVGDNDDVDDKDDVGDNDDVDDDDDLMLFAARSIPGG